MGLCESKGSHAQSLKASPDAQANGMPLNIYASIQSLDEHPGSGLARASQGNKNSRISTARAQNPQQTKIYKRQTTTLISMVSENKSNINDEYRLAELPLGAGAYGEVRKAVHIKSGLERAVKIVYKQKLSEKSINKKMQEIFIMCQLDHPNIIKIHEYFLEEKFIFIIMDIVTGGELFDMIQAQNKFTEADAAEILNQIFSAVNYLHKHGIVHRDIKPENILVEEKTRSIKLIDFGTSKEFEAGEIMDKSEGTPYYIAPEVLEGKYNEKCDEWSVGVIMYILLVGKSPFSGANNEEIFSNILKKQLDFSDPDLSGVSPVAKDLIKSLLSKDYKNRISAEEALYHPWFHNYKKNQVIVEPKVLGNLRKFNSNYKLQQSIYMYLVNNLSTKEDQEELGRVFKLFDANKDGVLTKEELMEAYQKSNLKITEQDVRGLLQKIDHNGSGALNFTEFLAAAIDRKKLLTDTTINNCFKLFDKDSDGKISVDEVKVVFQGRKSLDQQFWNNLVAEVDKNHNNFIDYDEFKELMIGLTQ